MCGIAGIIGPDPNENELQTMLLQQSHRGPDHTGTYLDPGFAALGHNRLSIIDLSAEANEPFRDNSGRFLLTFNGEIYNYQELRKELKDHYNFRTSSDTEVLLASYLHWGKDCLQKFRGMFAFAIWDVKEKKLFGARDRFGVKPFYYSETKDSLYFSSEIKTLQHLPGTKKPDEKVWSSYFSHGSYGMPEETFFEKINQLPGGHCMEFSAGKLKIMKWYHFKDEVDSITEKYSFIEAKEEYLEMLKESILLRFRSDVPVGFNISGGVDSSLLLALVDGYKGDQHLNAYTFYTGDSRYDELPWVEKMIESSTTQLQKVKLSSDEVVKTALEISIQQDEPYGGIPILAYSKIFQRAKEDGIIVLLDGQGIDEQWAGYDYYFQLDRQENTIQGLGEKSPFRKNVLARDFASLGEKPKYHEPFEDKLSNLQYRDLFYTKIPRSLRFNDRISMAYGIELREPFLDHKLVEFSFAMPVKYKMRQGTQKYLIREIVRDLVSAEISYAPKRPIQTPQREWLAEDLKDFVEKQLQNLEDSSYSHWFDHKEVQKEWKKYLSGERSSSFHIWQWVNAALLIR